MERNAGVKTVLILFFFSAFFSHAFVLFLQKSLGSFGIFIITSPATIVALTVKQ